jgi:hypothetical protein
MDHTPANLAVNAPASAGPVLAPAEGEDVLHCRDCGYDLRTLPAGRCPECGRPFDPDAVPLAEIPWLHRAAAGSWPAFWDTVWLGTFRPRQLASEARYLVEVDPAEARAFRNRCLLVAFASFTVVLVASVPGERFFWMAVAMVPAQLLFVWASHQAVQATDTDFEGVGYYDRLARLREFTAAPLGFSPALATVAVLLIAGRRVLGPRVFGGEGVAFFLLFVAAMMSFWWSAVVAFHGASLHPTRTDRLFYGATLAIVWALLAVGTFMAWLVFLGAAIGLYDLVF